MNAKLTVFLCLASIVLTTNACKDESGMPYPSEVDCTKFYMCLNGEEIEFTCTDGLYFNPKLNVCDDPENVDCQLMSTTPEASTTPPNTSDIFWTSTTEEPTELTTEEHSEEPTEVPTESTTYDNGRPPVTNDPLCPDEGTIFLPDAEDCTKFYECVDGDKYSFTCPGGLHFNQNTYKCDFPESAGCEP